MTADSLITVLPALLVFVPSTLVWLVGLGLVLLVGRVDRWTAGIGGAAALVLILRTLGGAAVGLGWAIGATFGIVELTDLLTPSWTQWILWASLDVLGYSLLAGAFAFRLREPPEADHASQDDASRTSETTARRASTA